MGPVRRSWWIAALAVGLLLGAVANLPMALVVSAVGADQRLQGTVFTGTVWAWRATTPQGVGVGFDAAPSRLVLGRYSGLVSAAFEGASLVGEASLSLDRSVALRDAVLDADLAPLARTLGMPPSALQGALKVRALELDWAGGRFATLACEGGVESLSASDGATTLELGGLALECATTATGPEVRIVDRGGPLALNARVALGAGGRFLLEGTAGARAGAPVELAQVLPLLGRRSGPDEVAFKYAGSFLR